MEKTEAIVDTCFLQKVSNEGKRIDNFKKILEECNFLPVVHPYIYEQEMALHSYSKSMVEIGYIRKIEYCEFLRDEYEKNLYEDYFVLLHEELRTYLEAKQTSKRIGKLNLRPGHSIYDTHIQGSSMGDVHIILMAAFMNLPIILTADSDIDCLLAMAKKRISLGDYNLNIYNAWDLIKQIAEKPESSFTKKDLEKILNEIGERNHRSEMKSIWNESHKGFCDT